MTILQAIVLGIVQGITEFLPVSSSGHLELFQHLFGCGNFEQHLFFDLICHLGTLLALIAVYFKEIRKLITTQRHRLVQVAIAIIPLFFVLPIMKQVEAIFNEPKYLGYFFLVTALLLYNGEKWGKSGTPTPSLSGAFIIGCFQTLALFPGISRSGATISAGRLLGWERQEAVTFSFLLAIPTILGGATIQLLKVSQGKATLALPWSHYTIGFVCSTLVGYCTLHLLIHLAIRRSLMPFAWYCAAIGIAAWFWFSK